MFPATLATFFTPSGTSSTYIRRSPYLQNMPLNQCKIAQSRRSGEAARQGLFERNRAQKG